MARNMEIIHAHNTMTRQRKLVRDLFIGKTTDTYWETHSKHIVSTLAIAKSVLMKPLK